MDDKYKKLVDTLPKESEDLWFEYNLAVNKIIQENQQLHNKIDKVIGYINQLEHSDWICFGRKILLEILKESE